MYISIICKNIVLIYIRFLNTFPHARHKILKNSINIVKVRQKATEQEKNIKTERKDEGGEKKSRLLHPHYSHIEL